MQPSLADEVRERLAPGRIERLGSVELLRVAALVWSDVELARLLYGSEEFVWERLLHATWRGYLTAQETQGLRRTLAVYRDRLGDRT